ncbi:hypothetical protein HK405_005939, partial [Cladochytrium tenue]
MTRAVGKVVDMPTPGSARSTRGSRRRNVLLPAAEAEADAVSVDINSPRDGSGDRDRVDSGGDDSMDDMNDRRMSIDQAPPPRRSARVVAKSSAAAASVDASSSSSSPRVGSTRAVTNKRVVALSRRRAAPTGSDASVNGDEDDLGIEVSVPDDDDSDDFQSDPDPPKSVSKSRTATPAASARRGGAGAMTGKRRGGASGTSSPAPASAAGSSKRRGATPRAAASVRGGRQRSGRAARNAAVANGSGGGDKDSLDGMDGEDIKDGDVKEDDNDDNDDDDDDEDDDFKAEESEEEASAADSDEFQSEAEPPRSVSKQATSTSRRASAAPAAIQVAKRLRTTQSDSPSSAVASPRSRQLRKPAAAVAARGRRPARTARLSAPGGGGGGGDEGVEKDGSDDDADGGDDGDGDEEFKAGEGGGDEDEDDEDGESELSAVSDTSSSSSEEGGAEEAPTRTRRRRSTRPQQPKMQERILINHPELATVWDDLASTPKIEAERISQPENVTVKLLPFQLEGVNWLQKQEEGQFHGGILADEMGMGKTIQLISLLVTKKDVRPNLILTPPVALLQWLAEFKERVAPGILKVVIFHGQNRETNPAALATADVVLSTYAIIEAGFRKEHYGFKRSSGLVKERSVLHSIEWGRVVLDEAHYIKERSCSTARAVFNLRCRYKWSLTGTPLQNRVGELYSLIRFLDADLCGHISHQHFCWWNAEILKPIQNYGGTGDGLTSFRKLGLLLDRIMLRRTKVERSDDLGLPPRVVTVRRDLFSEEEEELYESLYTDSRRQFSTYVAANTVLNNYASIFSLLTRMRLAVNHPDLVLTKLARKADVENLVCGICQDPAEDAVISKCKHVFCREDVREYMLSAPEGQACTCPVCFRPLSIDLTQPQYERKGGGAGAAREAQRTSIVNHIDMSKWRSSTKIEALVEELTALQRDDATLKSLVFSQFVAFLDLIQWRLARAGFRAVRLDGRMTPEARDNVIKAFMRDPGVTVFLVSLKAGGVALNLTEASR